MRWRELHETLAELVDALQPPEGSGLFIESADLTVPLEVRTVTTRDGIGVLGRVPHSRWKAGFLPAVSVGHLSVELTRLDVGTPVPSAQSGGAS